MPAINVNRSAHSNRLPGQAELDADTSMDQPTALHPLDAGPIVRELQQAMDWWQEANEALAEPYAQMGVDHDYYDHMQWSESDRLELQNRGQAPLVYNKLALAIDWVTGTERRTRIDFSVQPKTKEASKTAQLKQRLLKYQSDTNNIGWNRSQAFKDAAIGGVGWTEASIRGDASEELVLHKHVPWRHIKYDPYSTDLDCADMRYIHRRKWLDLDYAIAMYPSRENELRSSARSQMFGDDEWGQNELELPQVYRRYDWQGSEIVQRQWSSGLPVHGSVNRLRVPVTETWFRMPRRIKRLFGPDHNGVPFDESNPEHAALKGKSYVSITDAIAEDIVVIIWVPGVCLFRGVSPFKHGRFPFTPVWAKRRDRDGAPYGMVRGIRDAQDDLNKRLSKATWLLAANQLLYEEGSIDPAKKAEIQRNLARPNGMVEFKKGAMQNNTIKIERNLELFQSQVAMFEVSSAHINDGSGVNREMTGRDTNAVSGRAIRAKQEEGSVTTAELFDNLRLHVSIEGKMLLSLNTQYLTRPMQIAIAGSEAKDAFDWLLLNELAMNELGTEWEVKNDITKDDASFVVDQIDYRASTRAAAAEQFGEMMKYITPDLQASLLDLFVDMTDVPNREEAVKRIRAVTGQGGGGDAEDPEVQAQRQQVQAQKNAEQELQMRERMAQAGLTEAKAAEALAKAKKIAIEGKAGALDLAALIDALLPLAPSADRLYEPPTQGLPNADAQSTAPADPAVAVQ